MRSLVFAALFGASSAFVDSNAEHDRYTIYVLGSQSWKPVTSTYTTRVETTSPSTSTRHISTASVSGTPVSTIDSTKTVQWLVTTTYLTTATSFPFVEEGDTTFTELVPTVSSLPDILGGYTAISSSYGAEGTYVFDYLPASASTLGRPLSTFSTGSLIAPGVSQFYLYNTPSVTFALASFTLQHCQSSATVTLDIHPPWAYLAAMTATSTTSTTTSTPITEAWTVYEQYYPLSQLRGDIVFRMQSSANYKQYSTGVPRAECSSYAPKAFDSYDSYPYNTSCPYDTDAGRNEPSKQPPPPKLARCGVADPCCQLCVFNETTNATTTAQSLLCSNGYSYVLSANTTVTGAASGAPLYSCTALLVLLSMTALLL